MALVLEAPPACSSPMMGITLAGCFSERAKSLVMPAYVTAILLDGEFQRWRHMAKSQS